MACLCLYNGEGARDKELINWVIEAECHLMIRRTTTIGSSLVSKGSDGGVCYCFSLLTTCRNKWMGAKWCSVRKQMFSQESTTTKSSSSSSTTNQSDGQLRAAAGKHSTGTTDDHETVHEGRQLLLKCSKSWMKSIGTVCKGGKLIGFAVGKQTLLLF